MRIRGIIMALLLISSSLMLLGGPSTSTANAATYTCAQGGTCIVGNVGPGGGRVFYAPGAPFTVTGAPCSTTCRYLESAPLTGAYAIDNVTTYGLLGSNLHDLALETSSIGSGYSNTTALISALTSASLTATGSAGGVARAYRGSANLSDWFLPSSLEISAYWSSNPTDTTSYYMASNRDGQSVLIVSRGGNYNERNTGTRPVLPIRAFALASAPSISISQTSLSAVAGTTVTSYSIISSGGDVGDYSISPNIAAIPSNGISFSTTTGLISGTPTAAASSVTYTITAANGGGSTTATFSITVSEGTQSITFLDLSPITLGGTAPILSATASSNLTVSFTSARTSTCTVTGTIITVLTTGTCTINANQAGNGTYAAATQVQKSFVISPVPVVDDGAAIAAAAKRAAEQKELIEILALIPKIAELTLSLGETTQSLYKQKCVKGKHIKYVKNGAKCPKGYVAFKKSKASGS